MDRHTRVVSVAGLLSALALAAVFAAALGAVPPGALPRASDALLGAIPHVNAALSVSAFFVVGAGWRFARRHEIRKHRAAMALATLLFAAFLVLYLYRVALVGPTAFGGEGLLRTVYYAVLGIHILLAVVCVPLVIYVLTLAASYPTEELPQTPHPRVGRVAAALWMVSFALGAVVYLLLYA
jgi:putative membrane protein